jgi:hypothetical protein
MMFIRKDVLLGTSNKEKRPLRFDGTGFWIQGLTIRQTSALPFEPHPQPFLFSTLQSAFQYTHKFSFSNTFDLWLLESAEVEPMNTNHGYKGLRVVSLHWQNKSTRAMPYLPTVTPRAVNEALILAYSKQVNDFQLLLFFFHFNKYSLITCHLPDAVRCENTKSKSHCPCSQRTQGW